MHRIRTLLLATSALIPLGLVPAAANPQGPQVVGGSTTVQGQGTPTVTVTQQTNSAIINWNTFNIGTGEKTNIAMPSASSVQLDRVTGGLGPSQILGSLWSNGRVFLVNPDGILFGQGSKIDTGSFLGTTHDIANADFMAGRYNFSIPGNPTASIVNQGSITAQTGGFAALVAPGVRNSGTITATLGTVALASGNGFTLDFYGDKLITLGVSDSIATTVKDVSTGQSLDTLVKNEGTLQASGGRVELSAVAARQVIDSVINNTGVIEANSIGTQNGMIVLGAAMASSKPAGAPAQTVKVSGTLSAAGKNKGQTGGTIQITDETIQVTGAKIDASGIAGGGTVLIGGDVGGGKGNPAVASIPQAQLQPYAVPTASNVTVDAATTINAAASDSGNGGKVVVWADQSTLFDGSISVRGGAAFGNGGFVETSGHQNLRFNGAVDLAASNGKAGMLLLDPTNVTIGSGSGYVVSVAALETALASGNVDVTTNSAGSDAGDITINQSFGWSTNTVLSLDAYHNIVLNNATISVSGANGYLALAAGISVIPTVGALPVATGSGTVIFNGSSKIDLSGGTSTSGIFYNPPGGYSHPTNYNPYYIFNSNQIGADTEMWINSVSDLSKMVQYFGGTYYALNSTISRATATSNCPSWCRNFINIPSFGFDFIFGTLGPFPSSFQTIISPTLGVIATEIPFVPPVTQQITNLTQPINTQIAVSTPPVITNLNTVQSTSTQTQSITLNQNAFYIQSGTGAQLTANQVLSGSFPPGTFFIESTTGRTIYASSIHPTASAVSSVSQLSVSSPLQTSVSPSTSTAAPTSYATPSANVPANELAAGVGFSGVGNFFSSIGSAINTGLINLGAAITNLYPSSATSPTPSPSQNVPIQATTVALSQLLPDVVGIQLDAADVSVALYEAIHQASGSSKSLLDSELLDMCGKTGAQCTMTAINNIYDDIGYEDSFRFSLITFKNIPALAGMSEETYIKAIIIKYAESKNYVVVP